MDIEEVKKYLFLRLDWCRQSLRDLCVEKSESFNKLASTKIEDLPTLINEPYLISKWASERLKSSTDTEWDTPACWIEFLSNEEMSYEEYRYLGKNDGECELLRCIFLKMEMPEEAERAYQIIYSCD